MGVLSALPFVSMGNGCCCLWVVSGGLVAAYVLQQNAPDPINAADGAIVGLLAGIFGGLIQTVISIPVDIVMAPIQRAMLQRAMEMAGPMPPAFRGMVDNYLAQGAQNSIAALILRTMVGLFFALFLGMIFSTLGGLLGTAIFARRRTRGGPINTAPPLSPGGPSETSTPPSL